MAADQIQKRAADAEQLAADWRACEKAAAAFAVSYTHLTLPTIE